MRNSNGNIVAKKIEPGISVYADTPSEASEYLRPLLHYAARHVPQEKHKETPLYIMATAGLRLLDKSQQEAILDDLRVDVPMETDFLFQETHAEIITGKQEGIYAWIAVNYVLGNFEHQGHYTEAPVYTETSASAVNLVTQEEPYMRKKTVGVLDMGGGSTQIAFEVSSGEEVPSSQYSEVNLGCKQSDKNHKYRIYVTTFLGYGANVARKRYEQLLIETELSSVIGNISSHSITGLTKDHPIKDPCLPKGMPETVDYHGSTIHLVGSGKLQSCQDLLVQLLNLSAPCVKEPCSFNGVFQPSLDFQTTDFYGFSEYFYTTEDILRMSGSYNYNSFVKAAQDYCSTEWKTLEKWYNAKLYPKADENRFRKQCFKSAWLATVLHEGHKFPKNYKRLVMARLINGDDVQWTLGALLYKTRYYPLTEIQTKHSSHAHPIWWGLGRLHSATYLLLVCCSIVVVAIFIHLRRLKIVRRSNLRKIPSMGYFMTDENQCEDGILVRDMYFA